VVQHFVHCGAFKSVSTLVLCGIPQGLVLVLAVHSGTHCTLVLLIQRRIRRSEHITPALISLHWLRIPERISFKLAVMTYRSIYGTSPSYLQSCFTRVSDMTSRRWLRSSASRRLDVPPVRLSTVGRRAFPVSGATVWNDVPLHVASAPSLADFRQRLKTFLFSRSYQDTIIWLVCYYHHSSLLSSHPWSLQ